MLTLAIILTSIALLWMFFTTTTTEALVRLGTGRAIQLIQKHKARFFYQLFNRLLFPDTTHFSYLFASQLCEDISRLVFGSAVFFICYTGFQGLFLYQVLFCLASLLTALFIGDWVPYLIAKKGAEKSFIRSMPFSSFFLLMCLPITLIYIKAATLLFKKIEQRQDHDPIEEMREVVLHTLIEADVKGELAAADIKLIRSVVKFKDRIVREVMVPRIDLFCLSLETSIRLATHHFLEEGYSRIPVYQDSVDNIVGVLMFKDFLRLYKDAFDQKKNPSFLDEPVSSLIKTVLYTPETKKVSQLLQEFRSKQTHLAIVVDEYGGTEGVVTIEDLLEEIVGDIADEYDVDEEILYTPAPGGGGWIVDARMNVFDAEEVFGIHIPQEGDYDTLGGYLFHQVGSIPKKGLVIHHDDFTLEILSTTDRSVEKVKIVPRAKA